MTSTDQAMVPTRRLGYDLLRILSICGVVAIHTFGAFPANPDIRGTLPWLGGLLLSSSFIWAVPVFVMLSGALSLTERAHADGPASFYRKRALRIVPAVVAWTFIYLVLVRMVALNEPLSGSQILAELFDARVYPHLYFLWLIAGLYAVAPVLAAFLHAGGTRRAVITAGAALGLTVVVYMAPAVLGLFGIERQIQFGALTLWLGYVGYFVAGYALSLVSVPLRWRVLAAVGIVVFEAVILIEAALPDRLPVLRAVLVPEYLGLGVAVLAVCIFIVAVPALDRVALGERGRRIVVLLSEASFGVFLVHFVVLLVPYELLEGFRTSTSLPQAILAYAIILIVSFAISLGARRIPFLRTIF